MKEWAELTQDEKIDRLAGAVASLMQQQSLNYKPIPGYEVVRVEPDMKKWYGIG